MTASADEFTLSDELMAWLGNEIQLGTGVVEAGAIAKFADAIKDPNPLYPGRGVRQGHSLWRHRSSPHLHALASGT